MGKKHKTEEESNYEVWLSTIGGWKRVEEKGNDGIFSNKQRALLVAQAKSNDEEVVEAIVIERRSIAVFNGPAIAARHMLKAVEEKKEKDHGEVHRDSPEADRVQEAGAPEQHEAGADRSADRQGA